MMKTIVSPDGCHQVAMTADEIAAVQADQAAFAAVQPRLDILAQIQKLEAQQTPRRYREAALGNTKFMIDINDQIEALRAKL